MRGENQLPLAGFLHDSQQFSQQILVDTGVQLVNRECDGRAIICSNQQMQNGDDFFNALRFIF